MLLLAVPVLSLPRSSAGLCRLNVELERAGRQQSAGVMVEIDCGRVVACSSRLVGAPTSSASASLGAWLRAVIEGTTRQFSISGHAGLATALLVGLHEFLFA